MSATLGHARLGAAPEGERFNRLRDPLGVVSFGINEITVFPGKPGGIHSHERQEEVYLALDGELTINVDGEPQTVKQGELLRVPPQARRQLVNAGSTPVHVLAIGADVAREHTGKDGHLYEDWS